MKQRCTSQALPSEAGFDQDLLASSLRNKLREKALSLRRAARQIGCSPATLSRLLSGSTTDHRPDTATLAAAATWLNRSLADFDRARRPVTSSLAEIERHLRVLPHFTATEVRIVLAVITTLQDQRRKRQTTTDVSSGQRRRHIKMS